MLNLPIVALTIALAGTTAHAAPSLRAEGTAIHPNGDTAWCVDAAGGQVLGAEIEIRPCTPTPSQTWRLQHGPKTNIVAAGTDVSPGLCVTRYNGPGADGERLFLDTCRRTGYASQGWHYTEANTLTTSSNAICLTLPTSADGAPLETWQCTGAANQLWTTA